MASALDDLGRWLRALPPASPQVDWVRAESELGFALPSDYKEFVDRFGGCQISSLFVKAPNGRQTISDGLHILEMYFRLSLAEYRDSPGWPDYKRLIMWGDINSDPLLCWDRGSSNDPNDWRTVVFDTVGALVWLEGNMTTCIRDMISGHQRPEILGGADFADPKLWAAIDGKKYPVYVS